MADHRTPPSGGKCIHELARNIELAIPDEELEFCLLDTPHLVLLTKDQKKMTALLEAASRLELTSGGV